MICEHEEVELEKACCSGRDSDGLMSCGCGGSDAIICLNDDCTGIEDYELNELMDRVYEDNYLG